MEIGKQAVPKQQRALHRVGGQQGAGSPNQTGAENAGTIGQEDNKENEILV